MFCFLFPVHRPHCTTLHAGRHTPANVNSTTNVRATITATLLLLGRSACLLPSICSTFSICSKAVSSPLIAGRDPIGSRALQIGSRGLQRRSRFTTLHTRVVSGAADQSLGKMTERGAFILFEGVDRCGKTTQANLLVDNLTKAGHDACFMRFPGERQTDKRYMDEVHSEQHGAQPSLLSCECFIASMGRGVV